VPRSLRRAQIAVLSVLTSEVYVADLRAAMPVSVLNRHEWEVAVAMREITELRAEYTSRAAAAETGPMTAAILAAQDRALTLAQDATASRVVALETYAAQVEAAGIAQRDWQSAMKQPTWMTEPRPGCPDRRRPACRRRDRQPHRAGRHRCADLPGRTQPAALAAEALALPR
jgi:hypothetical protein